MKTLDPLFGLTAFLTVAETLSFSRAADDLGMSRATIGAQVRDLERRLGIRLFHRTTRTVVLTEAGTAYRQGLIGVLPQIREAERAASAYQQQAIGRLRISVPSDLTSNYVLPAVSEFLQINPKLTIDLDLSIDPVNLIEEGFDLAIRGRISVEPNSVTRQIGISPIVLCASPQYIALHGTLRDPEELKHHACLHFSPLRWGRCWQFHKGERNFRIPIVPRLEANDGHILMAAAIAGLGITLGPTFILGPALRSGQLIPLLTDWTIATIPIHAVYPANRHIAVKVRSFVSFLADRFAGHPDLQDQLNGYD